MSNDLELAFALISEFDEGNLTAGTDISASDAVLLKRLRADLMPNETDLDSDLVGLVIRVAGEDKRWNHKSMETIDAIYRLQSKGDAEEASLLRQEFLRECPSLWYRQIVDAA